MREDKSAAQAVGPAHQVTLPVAMKIVTDAMKADPSYAWSWHCNIAMAAFDEGVPHDVANRAAERFMRLLAGVEPAHPESYAAQPAKVEPLTKEQA